MRTLQILKIFVILIVFSAIIIITVIYPKKDDELIVSLAADGDINGLKKILTQGGNINARAFDDWKTPLIAASLYGHRDVVKFLVESGAEINIKDGGGTPLYWAAFGGQVEIFQYLISHGAKLNADQKSLSYLIQVIQEKGLTDLTIAVKAEALLESSNGNGCTAGNL